MAKQRQIIFFIVGLLAISFPIILSLGDLFFGEKNQQYVSFSKYYHSPIAWLYVIILALTSILLLRVNSLSQKGNIVSKLAGLSLFLSLVFPTSKKSIGDTIVVSNVWEISETLHITFGSLFFICVTFINYKFFSEYSTKKKFNFKHSLNKILSLLMAFSMIVIAIHYFFDIYFPEFLRDLPIKLIFEWIWCWSMGISWIYFYFKTKPTI